MEHCGMGMGAVFDGEWESLCKLLSFDEPSFETDKFLNHSVSSLTDEGLTYSLSDSLNNSFSQYSTSSTYDHVPLHMPNFENYHLNEFSNLAMPNDAFFPTNFPMMEEANNALLASLYAQEDGPSSSQRSGADSQSPIDMQSLPKNDGSSVAMPPKKKVRVYKNKGKKSASKNGNDEDDMVTNSESPRSEASDEGSNCSQETSAEENCGSKENMVSKGKKRASRGAATDPQSLYARKRRERINERLRILQGLVPNGTKVDISTMLEEALNYVKFLQLQIRLLSSDELWMYAPIAYNGVDISLYKRISPFLLP